MVMPISVSAGAIYENGCSERVWSIWSSKPCKNRENMLKLQKQNVDLGELRAFKAELQGNGSKDFGESDARGKRDGRCPEWMPIRL
jgi:hypothetical protein